MDLIIDKKAFRQEIVLQLINKNLSIDELLEQAKKLEDFVFQDQLTFYVENEVDRTTLTTLVKGFLDQRAIVTDSL